MQKKAVILISGGLDSTTTLAFAHSQGFACYALSFEYGQKHQAELNAARRVAKTYHAIEHRIVKLNFGELSESALTTAAIEVPDYSSSKEIPATYVPARNTVFLAIALGWAESLGAHDIFIGASSIDYSGYPDCRPEYFNAFQNMANFATKTGVEGNPIQIHAPLLYLSKAATIQKGTALGVDYSLTFSCYNPDPNDRACKRCASCTLRKKGFEEAGVPDPTLYQN